MWILGQPQALSLFTAPGSPISQSRLDFYTQEDRARNAV